jgi:very-short-patch-repair endonuclease
MGHGGTTPVDGDQRTRAHVLGWARDLIDLSHRNHALYHRPTKRSSLDLRAPDPLVLHRLLTDGAALPFFIPPPDETTTNGGAATRWSVHRSLAAAGEREIVTDRTEAQDLQRTLTNLMRTSNQDWLDRAVRTLYVAFGQLWWKEDLAGREEVRSPLVYLPVTLRRGGVREPFLLEQTDDDAVLNPSLVMKMKESFGFDLLPLADRVADMTTMDEVLEEVEELVDPLGWHVEHAAALKRATFHKESMYRDLVGNVEHIAEHALIRSLAGVMSTRPQAPAPIGESELDRVAPPEQAHLVLDADASQRRAVLAALQGASFVMDGPPGTGKSQTIVNMIAELIAAGRSVLFVSEKAAALEVVAKRLADVGLADFLLELHSHKANRREVVQELARAIRLQPKAVGVMGAADRTRLEQRRQELNDYAEAVNEARQPLARSVVWAAGRVVALQHAPELVPPIGDMSVLDLATLETIVSDAGVIAGSWDRVNDRGFQWRDAENDARPGAEPARRAVNVVFTALTALTSASGAVAGALELPTPRTHSEVERLLALADVLGARPIRIGPTLLLLNEAARAATRADLADIRAAARTFEETAERLAERYPEGWRDKRLPSSEDVGRALTAARDALPEVVDRIALTPLLLTVGLRTVERIVATIGKVRDDAVHVATLCGADPIALTREQAVALARVGVQANSPNRPDPAWLDARTSFAVDTALTALQLQSDDDWHSWTRVQSMLRREAVQVDLEGALRTHRATRGSLAALRAEARGARRTLSGALQRGLLTLDDHELDLILRAWRARRALIALETKHAGLVARFQKNRRTDVHAAREALGLAMDVRRAGGDRFRPDVAARQFCGSRPEDPDLVAESTRLSGTLETLTSDLEELTSLGITFSRNITLEDLSGRLTRLRDTLRAIDAAVGTSITVRSSGGTLEDLREDLELVGRATETDAALSGRLTDVRARLGVDGDFDGSALDELGVLESALAWADSVHTAVAEPITAAQARAFMTIALAAGELDMIRAADEALTAARDALVGFVGATFAARLVDLHTVPFDDARAQLELLRHTAEQLPEWWDHVDARRSLVAAGLQPQLEEASRAGVAPEVLPDALERALLTAWLEQVLRDDQRLSNVAAGTRSSRVAEFRRMDESLLADSAYRVIEACSARLPRANFGGAGLILREANKKSRHLAVRTLLERTGPVVTRLKPCLMMSPLSVSQYIPPDWRFDVVIFDEASQIPPQDAINCIYRGEQLIIAGDDRQLPPTSFFELSGNDEYESDDDIELDDFESILGLAKASDLLDDLGLRWHYRSRHEDLITFSNHRFYDGELITYPSSRLSGTTLGVVHHLVTDGVYHRGGRKDNPREAERVAEIVAQHVRTDPSLSIGVVALSSAQAEAIEDAIDRLRREDARLDKAFRSDRLDGFFVKNLENVQGDDRDIIVLSIGYGPDSAGRMTMNFGPMNQAGGWRRLNVAITRARYRMDVVSSFASDELRVNEASSRLAVLKAYLEYAESGPDVLAVRASDSLGEPESPLEEAVLRTIRSWGYDAVAQVGSASYRIDIGVRDPEDPDRYVLGVECDGAMYHSSKVARDRDRLRQQVLEGLGWRLHRVWGPAWFRNRRAAEDALRDAIAIALDTPSGPLRDGAADTDRTVRTGRIAVEHEEVDLAGQPAWATPYRFGDVNWRLPGDPTSQRGRAALRDLLLAVVRTESPVHRLRLEEAATAAAGRPLTGTFASAFETTLLGLTRDGEVTLGTDDFVRIPGGDVSVRYPVDDAGRRQIDRIAPEEVELAVLRLVADALALDDGDLERAVRDLFGFRRLGARIATAIREALERLERSGAVGRDDAGRVVALGATRGGAR